LSFGVPPIIKGFAPQQKPQLAAMPIYAYKCASCGHAKDVLQKISDAPLTECPACGAQAFGKQLTAPGFQLKGSGWYQTDFRGGGSGAPAADKSGDSKPAEAQAESSSAKPAENKAKPAAGGCGGSCACH
jgi:putative FmdB family regulatory protein